MNRGLKWIVYGTFGLVGTCVMAAPSGGSELQAFLNQDDSPLSPIDSVYKWTLKEKRAAEGLTIHDLWLRSQEWKHTQWEHQLTLVIPDELRDASHCLLMITGGSNVHGNPRWSKPDDDMLAMISSVARGCGSPVAVLRQVPNQPLYGGKFEDELIAFTFEKYLNTKDTSWPLLFPMVKSAVKAMDAIQEYSFQELNLQVSRFVVSGGSKRGWTTWLTGASDARVKAIAPMVIDVLNMPVQMEYQLYFWGDYSRMIQDYTVLDLPNQIRTREGRDLVNLVDPFSYRANLTVPKLILLGTNDPYWPADAIKFYYDELPDEKAIHYVANAGHGLGDGKQAVQALAAFFKTIAMDDDFPDISWTADSNKFGRNQAWLTVEADKDLQDAKLWTASSPVRDFREVEWTAEPLKFEGRFPKITAKTDLPEEGYKAFYMDLVYPSPVEGTFSLSTQIYVADGKGILEKDKFVEAFNAIHVSPDETVTLIQEVNE